MDAVSVAIAEYNTLHQEIIARLGYQETTIIGCLSLLAVVIATVNQQKGKLDKYRWAIPALSLLYFMAGWLILAQDRQIAEIGYYINFNLRPHVIAHFGTNNDWLLGWESYAHQKDFDPTHRLTNAVRAISIYGPSYVPGLIIFFVFIYLIFKNNAQKVIVLEYVLFALNVFILLAGVIGVVEMLNIYSEIQ